MEKTPILILSASKQPYLSVGIYSGGIKFNGTEYIYIPTYDAYLEKKYLKEYNKHMKTGTFESFIEYVKQIKK